MSNEILGHVTCPHCGNECATVHKQAKGKRRLYYRCYDGDHGACGTIQITLEGGQRWLRENMRPLNDEQASEAEHEAVEQARERQAKAASQGKKQTWLDKFMSDEE